MRLFPSVDLQNPSTEMVSGWSWGTLLSLLLPIPFASSGAMQSHWKSYQKDSNPKNSSRTTTTTITTTTKKAVLLLTFAACKRCVKSGLEASASPPGFVSKIGCHMRWLINFKKKGDSQKKKDSDCLDSWTFGCFLVYGRSIFEKKKIFHHFCRTPSKNVSTFITKSWKSCCSSQAPFLRTPKHKGPKAASESFSLIWSFIRSWTSIAGKGICWSSQPFSQH